MKLGPTKSFGRDALRRVLGRNEPIGCGKNLPQSEEVLPLEWSLPEIPERFGGIENKTDTLSQYRFFGDVLSCEDEFFFAPSMCCCQFKSSLQDIVDFSASSNLFPALLDPSLFVPAHNVPLDECNASGECDNCVTFPCTLIVAL